MFVCLKARVRICAGWIDPERRRRIRIRKSSFFLFSPPRAKKKGHFLLYEIIYTIFVGSPKLFTQPFCFQKSPPNVLDVLPDVRLHKFLTFSSPENHPPFTPFLSTTLFPLPTTHEPFHPGFLRLILFRRPKQSAGKRAGGVAGCTARAGWVRFFESKNKLWVSIGAEKLPQRRKSIRSAGDPSLVRE